MLPSSPVPQRQSTAYSDLVDARDAIRDALAGRQDVRLAYLFGSVAAGRAGPGSDLDVAVLFADDPAPGALDRLTEELEDVGGRRVDLVDLGKASPLLAHQVVSKGRCLVARNEAERARFETRTVLRYCDTAHLRRIQHAYLSQRAQARP